MKCFEGAIISVNKKDEVFKYLVEDRGRILYVGNELPEIYEDAKRIRLNGRALLPAFVDTHQHLASYSTFHAGLNVMDANNNKEIQEMVKAFAEKSDKKTLIAFGASTYSVEEGRLISRKELDAVCPDKEIMVVKYDGHACIVNSKLLKRLEKKISGLRGYHADTGEMNQEAFFAVSDDLTASLSLPELLGNMQQAVDDQAARGIGCIHTVSGVGFALNLDITLEQLFALSLDNGFRIKVFPQSMNVKTATRRKIPRIGGCFECALDGCFGSHDASMNEPYVDEEGGSGVLYYSDEKVTEFCKAANRAGLQIELHAIGDKAFDQAARALKAALLDYPRIDHRHGIIHACLPTKEGLEICSRYHIQLPMQSAFIGWKQEPDAYLASILGDDRAMKLNPLRTITDMGIMISAGSDGPCTEPDPINWIHKAVNHSNPKEALTIPEAIRMCTYNGAYAAFEEAERGSLEQGKIADMVILSANPYETAPEKLSELKVERLYLTGKRYKTCKENVAKNVIRGLKRMI